LAAFLEAVRSSDTKAVERIISADPALIQAKDRAGSTALHHAAGFGSLQTIKLLLDKGADPNAANRRKSTPLFWAISDEAKVRMLLDRGADLNASQSEGRTPLYQAALLGNGMPMLRLLLDKGANANAKAITGTTPLMAAAGRGNVEAMRLLIDKGADVNAKSAAGGTALMSAAGAGSLEGVKLLLQKGADSNVVTKRNQTALADAATAGDQEAVKLLLESGAKVDVQDDRGYTALLYAAGSDAMPAGIVKMLLAKKANPELRGDGETAGMLAVKRGDTEVARLLGVPEKERRKLMAAADVADGPGKTKSIAEAVKPALELLEKQSHNFIRIGGCNSCHAQDLPSAAAALARDRGLPAPKVIPQLPQHMHPTTAERLMDLAAVGISTLGWELFDFGMNRVPRDHYTDASVRFIKAMQSPEGNWFTPQNRRPPMTSGPYLTAALAIYSLKEYGPPAEKADTDKAITRAAAWLEASMPESTQDRAFHLLGLAWANGSAKVVRNAAKALAAMQASDGGWSQFATSGSDAYATGEALYALYVGGKMPASDPVYQKGMKYLLRTQASDGTWHVRSRSIWVQPYFESGFPYGHDQWISAAGTAWATMALAVTVEPPRISKNLAGE
jgi:ankyrin repeat protein